MKTTRNIVSLLLVLCTILLLISFFLPIAKKGSATNILVDSDITAESIYEVTNFEFNIYFILMPILAVVLLFIKSKYAETISIGLYIATFFCNLMYFLNVSEYIISLSRYTYGAGLLMLLISSSVIMCAILVLIIIKLIEKSTNHIAIEINTKALKESIGNLNQLKEECFITSEEYEEKRANLIKQLKI